MNKPLKNGFLWKLAAVMLALGVWQLAAMLVGNKLLLESPVGTLVKLFGIIRDGDVLKPVLYSFLRIFGGFTAAFIAGTVLAVVAGRFPVVEHLLWPYMITVKSVPVASFIVLALIWFSSGALALFTSALIVLPIIYTNVLQGIRSADKRLTDAAQVFRVKWTGKLRYVWLPAVKPFLISGCSVAAGMAWKAGVAAELIGIPDGSLGSKLYFAKLYIDSGELLSWTVIIVAASILTEKALMLAVKAFFRGLERSR